ncbi:MAG TPA: M1 family aminopeptidase [Polyangiales bacterium]
MTPPLYAPLPAPAVDLEAPPKDGRLPADVRPERYALWLEILPEQTRYQGRVAIDLLLDRPRESLWFHSRGHRISEARVARPGAEPLAGRVEQVSESGLSALRLRQPVGPGKVTLELSFEADFGTRLTGLYRVVADGKGYVFTQFEPTSAREAFPCLDEPRFKTPFEIRLVVPETARAVANTRELESQALPGQKREVRFSATEKLPTYLVAVAVGAFDVVEAPPLPVSAVRDRPLPLRGVAVAGRGAELAAALEQTPKLLLALEDYFGIAYPYDKLDLIAVPDFGAGAMENAGAITFRDTLLLLRADATENQKRRLAYVNAHELAHQWFGNLVTMPWWDDVWLNESFATWMGTRVVDEVLPEYKAKLTELSATLGAMDVDSQAAARKIHQPIESDHDIENAFDAITYAKGGAVLSMFERYLGADTFRAGLRLYMARHRFGNATAQDLVRALSEAAKKPELGPSFNSFLDQAGVPLVRVASACREGKTELTLTQERYAPIGSAIERARSWQIPLCLRYPTAIDQARVSHASGSADQCLLLVDKQARVTLDAPGCPAWIMPNSQASGYFRYALEAPAQAALLAARSALSEEEQIALANNLVAAMRAGTLPAEQALTGLLGLSGSSSRLVLDQLLGVLAYVRDRLLTEAELPSYRARVAQVVGPVYQQLGLLPPAGKEVSGEEKLLRAQAVRALGLEAREPALAAELAKLGRAQLGVEPHARLKELPSELIDAALTAALRQGDETLLARAKQQLLQESDGTVRARLLSAIGAQDQPARTPLVLNLALDPGLRVNERLPLLYGQMARSETRSAAYDWLKANEQALVTAVSQRRAADVISSVGGFCDEETAKDIEARFGPRAQDIPGGPRELALALESVRLCAALRANQAESARAYFAKQAVEAVKVKPARGQKPKN